MAKRHSHKNSSSKGRQSQVAEQPSSGIISSPEPDAAGRPFRVRTIVLLSLALFGLTVWAFFPAIHGDFIEYDDRLFFTGNEHTQTGISLKNIAWSFQTSDTCNWHPVTWWSHMLDGQLYGWKVWGHHLTNILLHAFNSVLVFLVLRLMTGAPWRCLIVAGLFALHPLRVESVAWISERKDVLCAMFWMLTIWAYAKSVRCEQATATGPPTQSKIKNQKSKIFYWLAVLFFALGLMSKAMIITLPFVLLLLDYWPLRRIANFEFRVSNSRTPSTINHPSAKARSATADELPALLRLALKKLPFFLLIPAACAVTIWAQHRTGSLSELLPMPFGVRLANALVSYVRYLGKLMWPSDLCALYPHPGAWPIAAVLFASVFVLGISTLAFRWRHQRGYFFTGWFWYLGALVPVIGIVQEGPQAMADRYSYIPCIGFLILLVWGLHDVTQRVRAQQLALAGGAVAAMLLCIVLTRKQIVYWKNDVTVWSRAVALTKDSFAAHLRLGRSFVAREFFAESIEHFRESVRIRPDYNNGEANFYLAGAYSELGLFDQAVATYKEPLKLPNPNHVLAYQKLGWTYSLKGDFTNAVLYYQKTLEVNPDFAVGHNNLGLALVQAGRIDEAIVHFRRALELAPEAKMYQNLGLALYRNGRVPEATLEFQRASEMEPDYTDAHFTLGCMLGMQGKLDEAIAEFRIADRQRPNDANIMTSLNNALEMKAKSGQ